MVRLREAWTNDCFLHVLRRTRRSGPWIWRGRCSLGALALWRWGAPLWGRPGDPPTPRGGWQKAGSPPHDLSYADRHGEAPRWQTPHSHPEQKEKKDITWHQLMWWKQTEDAPLMINGVDHDSYHNRLESHCHNHSQYKSFNFNICRWLSAVINYPPWSWNRHTTFDF